MVVNMKDTPLTGLLALLLLSSSVSARDLTESEKEFISEVVRQELEDPESANFQMGPSPGELPNRILRGSKFDGRVR